MNTLQDRAQFEIVSVFSVVLCHYHIIYVVLQARKLDECVCEGERTSKQEGSGSGGVYTSCQLSTLKGKTNTNMVYVVLSL